MSDARTHEPSVETGTEARRPERDEGRVTGHDRDTGPDRDPEPDRNTGQDQGTEPDRNTGQDEAASTGRPRSGRRGQHRAADAGAEAGSAGTDAAGSGPAGSGQREANSAGTEDREASSTGADQAEAERSGKAGQSGAESTRGSRPGGSHPSAGDTDRDQDPEQRRTGPVVRDRRRVDPETGQVRHPEPDDTGAPGSNGAGGQSGRRAAADRSGAETAELVQQVAKVQALADERLVDLQRLQAEYVNYRRRVDRDRDVARDQAVAGVLEALLPVLDDVHLARQHGDLESGPFAAIAEKLEATLTRFGLTRYGEPGETFDPKVHEALIHTQAELAEGTTDTTVVQVLQPGYRIGERVLRAARVAVADPD